MCCSNEHKSDKKAKKKKNTHTHTKKQQQPKKHLIAHMEKVVLIWIEDQYRQNILLS